MSVYIGFYYGDTSNINHALYKVELRSFSVFEVEILGFDMGFRGCPKPGALAQLGFGGTLLFNVPVLPKSYHRT